MKKLCLPILIIFVVLLANAKQPVERAIVYINWHDSRHSYSNYTFTDENGYYELKVAVGNISMVSAINITRGSEFIWIYNITNLSVHAPVIWKNFTLPQFPEDEFKIYGHVYNQYGAVYNATVGISFFAKNFTGSNFTFTDENGYYEIYVPSSIVSISVYAEKHSMNFSQVMVNSDINIDFYIEKYPPETAIIKGFIKGRNGEIIANANISVFKFNSTYYNFSSSDENGYYELRLPAGDFSIWIHADGYFPTYSFFRINDSEIKWLNISLLSLPPESAWVEGFVRDEDGNPIINATVIVEGSVTVNFVNIAYFEKQTVTDENGYYNVSVPAIEEETLFGMRYNYSKIDYVSAYAEKYFENESKGDYIQPNDVMIINITLESMPPENCIVKGYVYLGKENALPIIQILSPLNGSIVNGIITIKGIANDEDGSIVRVEIRIDNGEWNIANGTTNWTYEIDTTKLSNGIHIIEARAYDGIDYSNIAKITINVQNDLSAPQIFFIQIPQHIINYSNVYFEWDAIDDNTPSDQILFSYMLENFSTWSEWNYRRNASYNLTDGTYTFKVRAKDLAGNIAIIEMKFVVDLKPPLTTYSLNGTVGENGWYVSNVTVKLNSSDESGIDKMFYRINGGEWKNYTGEFILSSDGIYTIHFYSVDKAGNAEEERNFTVKIDKTKPSSQIILKPSSPNGENGWYVSNVTVKLNSSDNLAGIGEIFYKIDNGDWKKYEGAFDISTDGVHKIYYYSIDNAGNAEKIKNFTLRIDKKAPIASMVKPANGLYLFNIRILPLPFVMVIGKINIVINATDETAGINKVEFYWDDEIKNVDDEEPYEWLCDEMAIIKHRHTLKVIVYDIAGNKVELAEKMWIFNI